MKKKLIIIFCGLIVCLGQGMASHAQTQPAVGQDEDFVYESGGKRDPFWPLVNKGGGVISYDKDLLSSEMSLQGIMVGNDGKNAAIINGIIVKEGDTIGLYVVEQVSTGSVTLRREQEVVTLTLNKEE
ncbi:MAG TPA: hypothetical protein P5160_01390 [Candidatus Omnitrophota bacterium]|nr:hypothetical protein [Candidatus Omnitrophota bacterium]